VAGTAAALAEPLVRAAGGGAVVAALAGGTLWTVLWLPMSFRLGSFVGAGLTLIVLLIPAAVLGLFYAGLRDLAALPDRLSTHVSQTVDASVASYRVVTDPSGSWWGWGRRLLGRIWSLRSLLTEHRALLVRYGAMLRLVTPGFLLLVVGAVLATAVLVPGALLAVFVVWVL
jgi:hypothetical protein